MNKSVVTNLVAVLITLAGLVMHGAVADLILSTGLYALSGAVTNWLAIHMLFERVPGFYGSGVIPARFSEFRIGIRHLVMEQFFNEENLRRFLSGDSSDDNQDSKAQSMVEKLASKVDFNEAFEGLVEVIMKSSFAGMLAMVGGAGALKPLREPFISKMQEFLLATSQDPEFQEQLHGSSTHMLAQIENIVDKRLEELTPQLVKEIMYKMINQHLGWLVVWGGVVGGMIGLVVAGLQMHGMI